MSEKNLSINLTITKKMFTILEKKRKERNKRETIQTLIRIILQKQLKIKNNE
jgi:hypothetical protein